MLSRWVRGWITGYIRPILNLLMRAGVTPNSLSLTNLIMSGVTGLLIAIGQPLLAGAVLFMAGLVDGLDGALARESHQESPFGGFLDSISDHYGDFAILLGVAWWGLRYGHKAIVLLSLAALFGSSIGSLIRAKGEQLEIETGGVGAFTRFERNLVLIVGFFSGWILPALAVLAFGVHLSAIQRLQRILQANYRRITFEVEKPADGILHTNQGE